MRKLINKQVNSKKSRKKNLPRVPIYLRVLIIFKRFLLLRTMIFVQVILLIFAVFYFSGYWQVSKDKMSQLSISLCSYLGLEVREVYLEGQKNLPKKVIIEQIDITKNQPIFNADIIDIKNSLEELSWVSEARVERFYPSTINIKIVEKKPLAMWQYNNKLHLIDEKGDVIEENDLERFKEFIILVGSDANLFVKDLFDIIGKDEEVFKMISSAIRVGQRRWNIRLYNGIEIKLPEEQTGLAWQNLIQMQKKDKILSNKISLIDLRIIDKTFIK